MPARLAHSGTVQPASGKRFFVGMLSARARGGDMESAGDDQMTLVDAIQSLAARVSRAAALLVPAAFALLDAHGAAAQDCQADADCGPGYVCQVGTAGACSEGACTP